MTRCQDCGGSLNRGRTSSANPELRYCLVCETARLFERPRAAPQPRQRDAAKLAEYRQRWRTKRVLAALRR